MGVIKSVIADAFITSMWVFTLPLLGISSATISSSLGFHSRLSPPSIFITTILATIRVILFMFLGSALGGASYSPSSSLSLHVAGLTKDSSLLSTALRFPAQAAGGVVGVRAVMKLIPQNYQKGPQLKVGLHSGALAEGVLTFMFCFTVLSVLTQGPKNLFLRVWVVATVTFGLVVAGSGYTGPSMNPAIAMGWAYMKNWHDSWEFYYVFWVCPLIGAILAARVFKFLFVVSPVKQKKA